jgi:hypothetical protein
MEHRRGTFKGGNVTDAERLRAIADTAEAALEVLETMTVPNRAALNAAMRSLNAILERARPTLPPLTHPGYDRLLADIEGSNIEPVPSVKAGSALAVAVHMGWIVEGGRA